MTINDRIHNFFYKVRFEWYRAFNKGKFCNSSTEHKDGMEITFVDNFDEVSWNDGTDLKWHAGECWGLYHQGKPNVWYGPPTLMNGSLAKFTVNYNPREFPNDTSPNGTITVPFEVSLLSSNMRQQYGRFECRCTIPYDRGVWPAFWLWGTTWPPEIDVFELYGTEHGNSAGVQEMCLHYGVYPDNESTGAKKLRIDNRDNMDEFHEFAVEWRPDRIEFFTDGVKILQFTDKKILDKWFNVSIAQMQIIINHSIQEKYVKDYEVDYSSEFLVDYIRAYKFID